MSNRDGAARARRSYVLALNRLSDRHAEVVYMLNDLAIELSVLAGQRAGWVERFLAEAEKARAGMVERETVARRRAAEIIAARTPEQSARATWGGHPPPPVGGTS